MPTDRGLRVARLWMTLALETARTREPWDEGVLASALLQEAEDSAADAIEILGETFIALGICRAVIPQQTDAEGAMDEVQARVIGLLSECVRLLQQWPDPEARWQEVAFDLERWRNEGPAPE